MTEPTPKPVKPWRITTPDAEHFFGSQLKTYFNLNDTDDPIAPVGTKFDVHHFESGRWVLYERGVITANGWEPA